MQIQVILFDNLICLYTRELHLLTFIRGKWPNFSKEVESKYKMIFTAEPRIRIICSILVFFKMLLPHLVRFFASESTRRNGCQVLIHAALSGLEMIVIWAG